MSAATKTGKGKFELKTVRPVAEKLVAALAPYCEQIAVAGSIRRGKAEVGDIEIVAIPKTEITGGQMSLFGAPEQGARVNLLAAQLENMVFQGRLTRDPARAGIDTTPAWGERYKKLFVPLSARLGWMQLDLFLATPENWGAILAIRTGPNVWNKALMAYINGHTPYKQDGGALVRKSDGKPVPTRTERAYFDVLRLPFVEPSMRDQNTARRVFGTAARRVVRGQMCYDSDQAVRDAIRARVAPESVTVTDLEGEW